MDKRKSILAAALELFVTKGFHNTPTSKISKNAGVSTGTLFHYFPTKEDLIKDLFLELKTEFYSIFFIDLTINHSFKESFELIWRNIVGWGVSNPLKYKFLMQYHNSPFINEVYENEVIVELNQAVAEVLQAGIDNKLIKPLPIDYIMEYTFSQVYLTVNYILIQDEKFNQEEFNNLAWELFLDGISR